MNVALIAHDRKKELMTQFCIAYCGILAGHNICATATTGNLVAEATGLDIQRYLSCRQGGGQQIGAKIAYNEIDMVIFLSDPTGGESIEDVIAINRLCDQYNIPFATNIATAEVLIRGLQNGYLDWRNIVNPNNIKTK
jgi:methylglyoxal synthase